eukprot:7794074-Pyramimonas_sp.AAC.1
MGSPSKANHQAAGAEDIPVPGGGRLPTSQKSASAGKADKSPAKAFAEPPPPSQRRLALSSGGAATDTSEGA